MLDENTRAQVISDIGLKWRTFKTTLTTKYILPFKDNPELLVEPPTKYKFIDKLDWTKFVQSRLTPEFQVYIYFYRLLVKPHHCTHSHNNEHTTHSPQLHCSTPLYTAAHPYTIMYFILCNFKELNILQSKRQSNNVYTHRLSRSGYAGLEEYMVSTFSILLF